MLIPAAALPFSVALGSALVATGVSQGFDWAYDNYLREPINGLWDKITDKISEIGW